MKSLTKKLNEKKERAYALYPIIPSEIIPSWNEDRPLNEILIYLRDKLKMERDNYLLGPFGRLKRFFKGRLYNTYDSPCGSGILNPQMYAVDALLTLMGTERKFSKEKALDIHSTDEMKEICKKELNDIIDKYDGDINGSHITPVLEEIYEEIKMRGDGYYWANSKETELNREKRHNLLGDNIRRIWEQYNESYSHIT